MKKYFEDVIEDYNNGFIGVFEFTEKCNDIITDLVTQLYVPTCGLEEEEEKWRNFQIEFRTRCHSMIDCMLNTEE